VKFNPSHRYFQAGQICLWSQAVTQLISGEWVTCCLYHTVASSGWWRGVAWRGVELLQHHSFSASIAWPFKRLHFSSHTSKNRY